MHTELPQLPRSDCGRCQIANMASVTNADDNDNISVILYPVECIGLRRNKYFISVCLAIVLSLRYRLAVRDQV